MGNVQTMGTMFPAECVSQVFNAVRGKSSLAALCEQIPVAFTGSDLFTFQMDNEVALIGEGEQKGHGGIAVAPAKVVPVKIEYGARVTDEFMTASEEKKLEILKAFNEGFAAKAARGLDIMAMHGVNPRSGEASNLIKYYFDKNTTNVVTYDAASCDDNVDDAVAKIGDYDVTGIAMAKSFASAMGKLEGPNGAKLYPELKWGGQPKSVNGVPTSVNSTVSFSGSKDMAIVGDFANMFKWGYAKDVNMTVIPYGDPDNTGKDLAGHNQVYIRAEAYIGWAILDDKAFSRVITE